MNANIENNAENKKKILVVDDDLITAVSIQKILEKEGYEIMGPVANSGEAIRIVKGISPDLIIMDINLNDKIDGIQTAEKILENADIPIVFVTAYSDDSTIKRAQINNIFGYLLKPFDTRELLISVDIALFKHQAQKNLKEQENKYRNLLEFAPDAFLQGDERGNFINVNEKATALTGYSKKELLCMNMKDLFNMATLEKKPLRYDLLDIGKTVTTEREIIKKDGDLIYVEMNSRRMFDNSYQSFMRDITERKKIENKLKESEEKYRTLVNNALEGILITTLSGDILFVNHAVLTILETDNIEGIINKNVMDFLSPESVSKAIEDFKNVFMGIDSYVSEYKGKTSKGNDIWVESIGKKINYNGNEADLISIRNISERKKNELLMEEEFQKTKDIINSIPSGLFIYQFVEPDKLILISGNPAAEKLTGINSQLWKGKEFNEIWPAAKDNGITQKWLNVIYENKNIELEDVYYNDDRLTGAYRIRVFNIPSEKLGVAFEDITKIKIYEKDLIEKENKYRNLFENSPISLWEEDFSEVKNFLNKITNNREIEIDKILTDETVLECSRLVNITDINKTTMKIFEATDKEELTGNLDKLFIEESINVFRKEIVTLWAGKKHFNSEIKGRTLNGRLVDFIVEIVLIDGFEENWKKVLVSILDITDRKRAERMIIENQRLTAIGEMSSAVAHDFNNSLQTIFGNLELALLNSNLHPDVRKYLETIKTSATDAATRVQLLQRFGGKKQAATHYSYVDINKIIDEVIIQSRPLWKDLAERQGIEISIIKNLMDDGIIYGNDGELRSVLYNIVKNSIEAMPFGGYISFETLLVDENVNIIISDNGQGMTEESRKRIFQPFYTTKGFELGRGLGMSGAYTIIQEHKGNIEVIDSNPEKGTTLQISLPKTKFENIEKEEKSFYKSQNNISILWVDDDNMIKELAENILKVLGYIGDSSGSGKEALELIEKKHYDLVVTDIGMPGMSGWELAEIIKEKYSGKIKVAVQTGWGDQIDEEIKKQFGIVGVLAKPFKVEQIKKLISDIFDEKI